MIRLFAALSAMLGVLGSAHGQVERTSFGTSPFSLGTLTQADGALDADLWSGATADEIRTNLETLPVRFEDPAKRMMARRVLLSPGDGPEEAGAPLAALKLLRAAQSGYVIEAGSVAELTPGLSTKPGLSQVAAMRDLARGQWDKACGRGASLQEGRQSDFFVRLRAFCYINSGERAAAELTLSLAREEGVLTPEDQQMFRALLSGNRSAALPQNPLQYAAYRKLGGAFSKADIAALPPGMAAAAAMDTGLSAEARLAAVYRAALENLLPQRDLADAAATLEGTPIGDEMKAFRARGASPSERSGFVGQALQSSGTDSEAFLLRTELYAAEIAAASPDVATVPYAAEFALASLFNNRYADAERWMQTVAAEQSLDAERAFLNLTKLYSYLQPGPAQRLAGALGETLADRAPPPLRIGDPAAQASQRGDLAQLLEQGLAAAANQSRASQMLVALATASVETDDSELKRVRDTLGARLYERAGAEDFAREAAFRREALAAVGRLRDDVINKQAYVPRLKPARDAE
ncbi:MAG: hypothetical protein AAGH41_13355 [Pseudomonadota bacterium]